MKLVEGSGLFVGLLFHPIIPELQSQPYLVRDFTHGLEGQAVLSETEFMFDVGRYNERRQGGMYSTDLFRAADPWVEANGVRDIHIGVDVGGPVGTPVHAVCDGVIHCAGYNEADGDYGNVIVTEQMLNGHRVWMLYGHLSAESTAGKAPGDVIKSGTVIGWLGDRHENGNWPSHVHFQMSLEEPATHDMPGVVSSQQVRLGALETYPDPRMVLGPLYDGDGLIE